MTLPTDVPADATPARCPYCEAPFPDDELLTLHVGLAHEATCTEEERAAFEAAHERETDEMRRFQLKALGLLVLLYFGLLMTYAVAA